MDKSLRKNRLKRIEELCLIVVSMAALIFMVVYWQ